MTLILKIGNEDYRYQASYEVFPEFELDFSKCKAIKNPQIEIDDQALDKMIDWLRLVYGKEVKSDERAIEGGDSIVIDLAMYSQDKDSEGNPEKLLELNKYNFIVPIYKPERYLDFPAQALLSKKVGDEVTWKHEYEKDFANPVIAGQTITLKAIVNEVQYRQPLSKEKLYEKLGLKNKEENERRKDIKKQVIAQLDSRKKQVLMSRINKTLVNAHKFEIPPSFLEEELMKIGQNLKIHPALLRNSEDKKHKALWERFETRGISNASSSIIWMNISEKLPEKVTNEEVLAQVKVISEEFENPSEVYKNLSKDKQTLMRAYDEIHKDKIINWLKTQLKFEDDKVDFAEFMIG